ncbi:MAG: hypothetical protein JO208_14865 [Alphaproteobacteria bacterium]|nr:hypothetical protein [Alphaproteobacteria bacterium]
MRIESRVLAAAALVLPLLATLPAGARGWSGAGKLAAGVNAGNAFALSDGRVVSVGIPSVISWWPPTTQIWNPSTNKWTKSASTPPLPDVFLPAPALLNDGRVLVTGYCKSTCGSGSNTEIYDPATDSWSMPGQMTTGRYLHQAVKLADGRVLVMGGCSAYGCAADTASAEIFDPTTAKWSAAAAMKAHRASFSAILLSDGRVLVTGGYNSTGTLTENETYDPVKDTWTVNAPMPHPHAVHVSVTMKNGRVLVAGGDTGLGLPGREADVFDPSSGKWKAVGMMAEPREYFGVASLPNGKVLVIGGYSYKGEMFVTLSSCETFCPGKDMFAPAKPMKHERSEFSVATLPDGTLMAAGGDAYLNGEFPVAGDAELYKP